MERTIINEVYEAYAEQISSPSSTTVNYLSLGRELLTKNYRREIAGVDTSVHNQNVINSILSAANEKLGKRYISSLKKTLENRLLELGAK